MIHVKCGSELLFQDIKSVNNFVKKIVDIGQMLKQMLDLYEEKCKVISN